MAEGLDAMTALRLAREQIAIAREHGIEGVVAPPKRRRIINEKPHEFAQQPHLKKSVVIDNADTVSKVEEMVANPTPASNPRTEEDYDKLFYQPSVPHMDQDTIRQKFMGANSELGTPMHSEPVKSSRVAPKPFRLSDDEQQQPDALPKEFNTSVSIQKETPEQQIAPEPNYNVKVQPTQIFNESVNTGDIPFVQLDEIPSKNRFYNCKLKAEPLRLKDLLIIENLDKDNLMDSFSDIYSRRIKPIDPLDIVAGDEEYILQYLRASTFERDPYAWTTFKCKHCGFEIDDKGYKIDFTNMRFECNRNPDEIYELHREYGYYPIKISTGYINGFIRRRRHDYIYNNKISELKAEGKPISKVYLALLNTALVTEINGCHTLNDKIEYIGNLSKDDSAIMYDALKNCMFKTKTQVVHTCPNCGGTTVLPFPFRYDTFISSVQITRDT